MRDSEPIWALVPAKHFDLAKSRLAGLLDQSERRALASAMLKDVLAALAATRRLARILVITRAEEVAILGREAGATTITETGTGLNAALTLGARTALAGGAAGILVVHGDLPLASSQDFDSLLSCHDKAPAVTLVPDLNHNGSNCLAISPPNLLPFRFGTGSFLAHCAEAKARDVLPRVVECQRLAIDVDCPETLRIVSDTSGTGHTLACLRNFGIASRIHAATRHQGSRSRRQ